MIKYLHRRMLPVGVERTLPKGNSDIVPLGNRTRMGISRVGGNTRQPFLICLVLLAFSPVVRAQHDDRSGLRTYGFYGNVVRGLPDNAANHHLGAGIDYVFKSGLAIAIEGGVRGGWHWDEKCDCLSSFSANGSYYPLRRSSAIIEPFVTTGYTYSSFITPRWEGSSPHMLNFGAGFNYWFMREALALRFEVRDHLSFTNGTRHFPELRIGLTLEGLPIPW